MDSTRVYRALLACGMIGAVARSPLWAEETADDILITASRLGDGLVGSATSIVSAQDLAADPAADLPDILARQAGIQLQSVFGGVNGAQTAIGLRGFGATATENTLVLVNGRRINDPDQSNIDFSAVPLSSIQQIEIIRGNSAAVLYGDGAVGGAINIITKNGDNSPAGTTIDAGFGTFQYRSLDFSTNQKVGGTAMTVYGSEIVSNGYRDNNALRERNFDSELRQDVGDGKIYLNLRGDDQYLGLPGAIPSSVWASAGKTTQSPNDFGGLQSVNATVGFTQPLAAGSVLVIDASLRRKEEQTVYNSFGGLYYGIAVTTASFTPRLIIDGQLFGFASKTIAGIDLYQSFYASGFALAEHQVPYDDHRLDQRTLAIYGDETLTLSPDTTLGAGLRLQRADLAAREKVDAAAPGYSPGAVGTPLNQTDNEYAAHLGIEQRLSPLLRLFARIGHAMRMPNLDDRNFVAIYPTNFQLKTQESDDAEIGAGLNWGRFSGQTSLYAMDLHNEIDYDPGANGGLGANTNLDPTRRVGSETELAVMVSSDLQLHGTVSVTDATFRAGPYKGNEVPQIALLSGSVGAAWTVWPEFLTLNADLNEIGKRRLGDDFTGALPMIPAASTVDVKLSGRLQPLHWSISAQNLFDVHSYGLGYPGYTPGSYSVYPTPGRSVIGRLGVGF